MADDWMPGDFVSPIGRPVDAGHVREAAWSAAAASGLQTALVDLLTSKGLYQNTRVQEGPFGQFTDSESLVAELRQRPIFPLSHGERSPDVPPGGPPGQAITRTPPHQRNFVFVIPNVNLECATCKRVTTFLSMSGSDWPSRGTPYPISGEDTEQLGNLYYRCGSCRTSSVMFAVIRRGLRLQLVGRSIPFRPPIAPEWPKSIQQIVKEALRAVAENDVAAGYYHLRTALEHFIKAEIGLPVTEKIEGTDLCERYNQTADPRLKASFPALGPIYSALSGGMHSRQVSTDEFDKNFNGFLDHLKAKAMFSKFPQQGN